jgi:hypothetical protein
MNVAELRHDQGRRSEAVRAWETALSICRRSLGPKHPDTLACRETLARVRSRLHPR